MLGFAKHMIGICACDESAGLAGVQIGRGIVHDEAKWTGSDGINKFDLLDQNTAFSGTTYPLLAAIYPSLVTPTLTTPVGSGVSYKIVADLT